MMVALVGNQNSGKTTLFNTLTGLNSKVGNWPGVTVEKKSGIIIGTNYDIVDLPGIYSLSPYSTDELISRKFILEEKPDVIINVIDSTCLERSLYLTTQLLELDCRVIIALNMVDIAKKRGLFVNPRTLSKMIGVPVVQVYPFKKNGISNLIDKLKISYKKLPSPIFNSDIENTILNIQNTLDKTLTNKRFVSVKLLEGDSYVSQYCSSSILTNINSLTAKYEDSLEEIIATERYSYIENILRVCVNFSNNNISISDKIDKFLLNKWISFPFFFFVMFFMYYLSVGVLGHSLNNLISNFMLSFCNKSCIFLESFGIPEWLNSLIIHGVFSGVGAVLGFIPELAILFTCISILEASGYMSRIGFILDRIFREIGLSGKSLIPFIVGSGCSVPGIESTRILENDREKKITSVFIPFIPCSAKLPIIVLFTSYFFEKRSSIIATSLYFLSAFIIVACCYTIKKLTFKSDEDMFITELPDYRIPNFKHILKDVFDKISSFLKKAGTIILLSSVLVWFMISFSFDFKYVKSIEDSILAQFGKKISWFFFPFLGVYSWEASVSALQGLVAKEQVISSMSVISGFSASSSNGYTIFNIDGPFSFFTKSSAYAFIAFNLFSAPCFSAIGAMKHELGGIFKALKAIFFQTSLAWFVATFIYQTGICFEKNTLNSHSVMILVFLLIVLIGLIISLLKDENKQYINCIYCNSICKKK